MTGTTATENRITGESLLEVKDLSAAYDEREVVHGVSFNVQKGEVVCIVGESGSGKSTLIRAIHGMNDLEITGGAVFFEGKNISRSSYAERRSLMGSGIGLIPQDPAASFNPIRRFDIQFRESMESHGMSYDEEKITQILSKIGLKDAKAVLRNRPYELSGGMNQRIAIAAAMLFRPKLLLCDEATSALDVTTAGIVVDELLKIREDNDTAILMVTHHLGIAKRMADTIGIMKDGRIIETGSAESIFKSPKDQYTRDLINNVPKLRRS